MPFLTSSPAKRETARAVRLSAAAVLAAAVILTSAAPVFAQKTAMQPWTLDEIYGPDAPDWDQGSLPDILAWTPDSRYWIQRSGSGLAKVEAATGRIAALYSSAKLEVALAKLPRFGGRGPAATTLRRARLTTDAGFTAALLEENDEVYLFDLAAGDAAPLAQTPEIGEKNASFSPDGQKIAFVRGGNLFVTHRSGPRAETQLTRDGSDVVLNGRLDWVYEEEVYGRGNTTGYWWSPDGRYLAYLRIDDSPIKPFQIVDHLPQNQNTENWRYPKAGNPNPLITLAVVSADGSAAPRFIDLGKYPENDRLIVRVAWHPNSKQLTFQMQNRIGSYLDLNIADIATGKTKTLFRETTPAWVEIIDNPRYLKDGTFLWLSDRTGYRHIYRYKADGTLHSQITRGDWDAKSIKAVNEDTGVISFTSNQHSWLEDHAYRIHLDGSGMKRLTEENAHHNVQFSPDGSRFLDTRSSYLVPPSLYLCHGASGKTESLIADNSGLEATLAAHQNPTSEYLQVKTRDGFLMEAQIIKPADFDPGKRYPVYMSVYGGPGAQTVRNGWGGGVGMFERLLTQKGIIVWRCDNRSASGKGAKSAWSCYKKLGVTELADIEDSILYLKGLPYIDYNRIAISGWSYGGFMTEYALTHSKMFKIGISGAGVSDWHLYDTIYTERYMDTPQNNAEGYRVTSCVEAAKDCSGKLLLIHGMMDDNVHLQNTIQLVYALQKAGKDFEMMLYPSPRSRHGIGDRDLSRHLRELELRFIEKNL